MLHKRTGRGQGRASSHKPFVLHRSSSRAGRREWGKAAGCRAQALLVRDEECRKEVEVVHITPYTGLAELV